MVTVTVAVLVIVTVALQVTTIICCICFVIITVVIIAVVTVGVCVTGRVPVAVAVGFCFQDVLQIAIRNHEKSKESGSAHHEKTQNVARSNIQVLVLCCSRCSAPHSLFLILWIPLSLLILLVFPKSVLVCFVFRRTATHTKCFYKEGKEHTQCRNGRTFLVLT